MVKNFDLTQKDDNSFENKLTIYVYQGETINLTFSDLDFSYSKANVRVNNIFVGVTTNSQLGIHSSKLKIGLNDLKIDFLNASNEIVKTLSYQFVVSPASLSKSIDEEFASLFTEIELLKNRVSQLESWRQEIDNERSGY